MDAEQDFNHRAREVSQESKRYFCIQIQETFRTDGTVCLKRQKYMLFSDGFWQERGKPVVIFTSSVALQRAILSEYIPFLSKVLLEVGLIHALIRAIARKRKNLSSMPMIILQILMLEYK